MPRSQQKKRDSANCWLFCSDSECCDVIETPSSKYKCDANLLLYSIQYFFIIFCLAVNLLPNKNMLLFVICVCFKQNFPRPNAECYGTKQRLLSCNHVRHWKKIIGKSWEKKNHSDREADGWVYKRHLFG